MGFCSVLLSVHKGLQFDYLRGTDDTERNYHKHHKAKLVGMILFLVNHAVHVFHKQYLQYYLLSAIQFLEPILMATLTN